MSRRGMTNQANGLDDSAQPDPVVVAGLVAESFNKKFLVLQALHKNGRAQTVQDLLHWTKGLDHGLNAREITKILWGLQKQGLVAFHERMKELVKIELTSLAVREFFPKKVREVAPVERINVPARPKIVRRDYVVPEAPRYSAPPPPPQNTKTLTDVSSGSSRSIGRDSRSMEAQGREGVVDTHTQYLNETVSVYPNSPNTDPSRRRVLKFVQQITAGMENHNWESGWVAFSEAAALLNQKTSATVSLLAQAGVKFGYIDTRKNAAFNELRVTSKGVEDLNDYRELLDERTPPGKRRVKPMEVVRRDEADAEKRIDPEEQEAIDQGFSKTHTRKPSMSMGDAMEQFAHPRTIPGVMEPSNIGLPAKMSRDDAYVQGMADAAPNLEDYPLIADLMKAQVATRKYEEAAALLMETDEELALTLLDKIKFTDLEKEVIRYVRAVTG